MLGNGERNLAIFIDFENLALGFQSRRDRFEIGLVLKRLVEKGKIVAKKAYGDWNRFSSYTSGLHEAAIELVEIPRRSQTGKNSADIRLCVDAMDLAYSKEHINTFVVVSGDSDFSPLVSKLKELGKHVIGLGMQESTSNLLRDNCDEFIYYEDLGQTPLLETSIDIKLPETKKKVFNLLLESLLALRRENKETLYSSMVKDTMKRKKPSFNETYHGYRTFSELLIDAASNGLVELDTDKRSKTYVVTRFGSEIDQQKSSPVPSPKQEGDQPGLPAKKRSSRRRGSSKTKPALTGPSSLEVTNEAGDESGIRISDSKVETVAPTGTLPDAPEAGAITDDDLVFTPRKTMTSPHSEMKPMLGSVDQEKRSPGEDGNQGKGV